MKYFLARFLSQSRQILFHPKKKAAFNSANKRISKEKRVSRKNCLFQYLTINKYQMLLFVLMIQIALMDILFSIESAGDYTKTLMYVSKIKK